MAASSSAIAGTTNTVIAIPNADYTSAVSINNNGVLAGEYSDSDANVHGLIRAADGTLTDFKLHKLTDTHVIAINDSGTIAGYSFSPRTGNRQGFVRARTGRPQFSEFREQTLRMSQR